MFKEKIETKSEKTEETLGMIKTHKTGETVVKKKKTMKEDKDGSSEKTNELEEKALALSRTSSFHSVCSLDSSFSSGSTTGVFLSETLHEPPLSPLPGEFIV